MASARHGDCEGPVFSLRYRRKDATARAANRGERHDEIQQQADRGTHGDADVVRARVEENLFDVVKEVLPGRVPAAVPLSVHP